ncbi:RNA polymerase sigma-70 factor [Chitinophaga sp. MM2321]|uniref:RNA polymerase sigma factor n=1 Tax=Chitinophaga sp. MM2321 TaxID=3137178 RepID=UPI0032D585B1
MNQHNDDIDIDLFTRLSRGDEAAFSEIVHFYYKRFLSAIVFLTKSKPEAQDIMQDVFLKLWLYRKDLHTVENPKAWIRRILLNTTSNHIRARLRYELKIENLAVHIPGNVEMIDELEALSTQRSIDKAVDRLPQKRRQIFLMSRREGLSRKEIAQQLNISENTVRNQLVEALNFIREYLKCEGIALTPAIIILQNFLL